MDWFISIERRARYKALDRGSDRAREWERVGKQPTPSLYTHSNRETISIVTRAPDEVCRRRRIGVAGRDKSTVRCCGGRCLMREADGRSGMEWNGME